MTKAALVTRLVKAGKEARPMPTADTVAQHTPGPWAVRPNGANSSPFGIEDAEQNHIASAIFEMTNGIEGARANARLIAAAPDMLAALKRLWELGQEPYPEVERETADALADARNAIAKAEGR